METAERRQILKQSLVAAAARTIERRGLAALKARELAEAVGCAVGAIYNVVEDLDDLVLAVNSRTLASLEGALTAAGEPEKGRASRGSDAAIGQLVRLSIAYLDFAAAHRSLWRAVFEHRLPRRLPEWYLEEQMRLFGYIEEPLRMLLPGTPKGRRALLARTLFSAVHGIVTLGLEEKLHAIPPDALREQVTFVVSSIGRGMLRRA